MYAVALASLGVLMLSTPDVASSQGAPTGATPKTLAVVVAHADDEGPVAPILARRCPHCTSELADVADGVRIPAAGTAASRRAVPAR